MAALEVVLEVGTKRSFACSLWFPGWFGHGKTPDAALERLLAYRERYAPIASAAKVKLPSGRDLVVVETLAGDTTTDFGAPSRIAAAEASVPEARLRTLRRLHAACIESFDATAAAAPEELRKGPRGGGRDTSKVIAHVAEAEKAYASKFRRGQWPEAYYLRRSGYHFTDHAWEIEDRSSD